MTLTSKQRAYLMSLANSLDPVFQVGKSGVTPEVTEAVSECFHNNELIKLAVLKNCMEDPREIAKTVAGRTQSTVVRVIGKRIILYKKNKDHPKIELPRAVQRTTV
ncbi:MAG: ribosome assembly RNA-binding protein YhbY [Candidatus Gastranaerophilales bacterium]|nr:ribosome assembly RNA-binding protein YhbY [Candidatus Gastranaerophilales bacterium]